MAFRRFGRKGFTLFEVLLAISILVVAIVPIVRAYRPSVFSTGLELRQAICANQARQTLNRLLSLDFNTLWANQGNPINLNHLFTASDETFFLQGFSQNPVVSIVDASGGAGGLVEITVTAADVTFKALRAGR